MEAWGDTPIAPAPLFATASVASLGALVAWGDQLTQGLWGIILGIVAVIVAVAVPVYVEWKRRPRLLVVHAPELEVWFGGDGKADLRPRTQMVHVRVVNEPMIGFPAKWLLTHYAVACEVQMRFLSEGSEFFPSVAGRWSGTPQPIQTDWHVVPFEDGSQQFVSTSGFNQEAVPPTLRYDLPPHPDGQVVAVALKVEAHEDAYAFSSESYAHPDLEHPSWKLPPGTYIVEIQASAGSEIKSPTLVVKLTNPGTGRAMTFEPI